MKQQIKLQYNKKKEYNYINLYYLVQCVQQRAVTHLKLIFSESWLSGSVSGAQRGRLLLILSSLINLEKNAESEIRNSAIFFNN